MSFKYTYDEHGVTFYYFLISFMSLVLLPLTYYWMKKPTEIKRSVECHCDLCHKKEQQNAGKARRTKNCKRLWLLACFAGWIFVAYLVQQVANAPKQTAAYDPYAILGLEPGATESEVKKRYKLLSLSLHPDKVAADQKEQAEQQFVEISRAHQALTDPVVRENWEKYGNPDGIKSFSLGIALPAWLVESAYSWYVLSVYILVFGLALPFYVGKWWTRSRKYTKSGILHMTMALFYREMKDGMSIKKLLEVLSSSMEFKEEIEWRPKDNDAVLQFFQKLKTKVEEITGDSFERSKKFTAPYCLKAYTLLYAHLFRIPVEDADLLMDQKKILEKTVVLLSGLLQIAISRDWLITSLNCVTLSQLLVQAVSESQSPLLQLPHFDSELLKQCRTKRKNCKSIKEFVDLPAEDQRSFLSSLTDAQFKDVVCVARSFPVVTLLEASLQVLGHQEITTEGLVTCKVKIVARKCGEPAYNQEENSSAAGSSKEEETFDVDEDGMVEPVSAAKRALSVIPNFNDPVHAPYLPSVEKRPCWWVFVATKSGALLCPPSKVFDIMQKPKTVLLHFRAPSKPSVIPILIYIKCDAVYGTDLFTEIKMNVVAPSLGAVQGKKLKQAGEGAKSGRQDDKENGQANVDFEEDDVLTESDAGEFDE